MEDGNVQGVQGPAAAQGLMNNDLSAITNAREEKRRLQAQCDGVEIQGFSNHLNLMEARIDARIDAMEARINEKFAQVINEIRAKGRGEGEEASEKQQMINMKNSMAICALQMANSYKRLSEDVRPPT